jgi:hypothetical protein
LYSTAPYSTVRREPASAGRCEVCRIYVEWRGER